MQIIFTIQYQFLSKKRIFCKNDSNSKSNAKLTHGFFKFIFVIVTLEVWIIFESTIICFFENGCFTRLYSSSAFIYNIDIVINTSTTMTKQFQTLNAPKINIYMFIFLFITHTNHFSFTSSLISSQISYFYFKIYKFTRITQVHDFWSNE